MRKNRNIYFSITFFCAYLLLSFQAISQKNIVDVEFQGLKLTKEMFLEKIISIKVGDNYDSLLIIQSISDIEDLELFKSIAYTVKDTLGGKKVVFMISETNNINPLLGGGQFINKAWVKVGVEDVNFDGDGSILGGYYQFFDDHSFGIYYSKPYIRNSNYGIGFSIEKLASVEPVYFQKGPVDYIHESYTYVFQLFNQPRPNKKFNIDFEYHSDRFLYERNADTTDIMTPNLNNVSYERIFINPSYTVVKMKHFRNRDLQAGFSNNIEIISGIILSPLDYIIDIENEFCYFIKLGNMTNIAMRAEVELATNHTLPQEAFFIDDRTKIRHSGNRSQRGTAGATFNFELRNVLLSTPSFGIQTALFADLGAWRPAGGNFADMFENTNFQESFVGAGIRIRTPGVRPVILRFDYGYDFIHTNAGLSFGLGQYF